MSTVEIDAYDDADRWQWVCPQGHRSWEATNNHFWCKQCADQQQQGADVEPEFSELVNQSTRETFQRDEITIRDYRQKTA